MKNRISFNAVISVVEDGNHPATLLAIQEWFERNGVEISMPAAHSAPIVLHIDLARGAQL